MVVGPVYATTYLDLSLDILDGVTGLHLEGDGLAREGLHKDLHGEALLPSLKVIS